MGFSFLTSIINNKKKSQQTISPTIILKNEYAIITGLSKPTIKVASYTVTVGGFFEKQVDIVNRQGGVSFKSIISNKEAKYLTKHNTCILKLNQSVISESSTSCEIIAFNHWSERYSTITFKYEALDSVPTYLITMNKVSGEVVKYTWISTHSGFRWTLLDSCSLNKLLIYNAYSSKTHTLNQNYRIREENLDIFLFTLSIIIVNYKDKKRSSR
ncbi:hypothetical protein K502DRAFT_366337 [Neoconidiobolus thromboides FSU 785]|nr:hypothetical protein K502DRAFT_366337 [Neoconidiobolus thromboides FSU 785]